METHGSFHGIYACKLQFMEAMEASTFIDSGNMHVFPWKLLLTKMGVHLRPLNSVEITMEVNLLPPTSMKSHRSKFSIEVSMEVNCASIEVTFTYIEVSFGRKFTSMDSEIDRPEDGGPLWKSSGNS